MLLRARLLAVVAPGASLLAGCPPAPRASDAAPAASAPASTAASASPAPAQASSSVTPAAATARPAAPAASAASCSPGQGDCECYPPRSLMRGGEFSRSKPRPQTYDENGCAPVNDVTNGCCNQASEGPFVNGGQCCYRFHTGSCCGRPLVLDGALAVAPLRRVAW